MIDEEKIQLNSEEQAESEENSQSVATAVVEDNSQSDAEHAESENNSPSTIEEAELDDADKVFGIQSKYVYHLSDFDGPLDLLLELISRAKIRIEDIFVSEVTHQYVEIIKNTPREELDYEYAGEFITLAAELVYLKSKHTNSLFEEKDEDPEDEDVEREEFIRKLKLYAIFKEESEKLREMETINRFEREPVYTEKDYRVCLTDFSLAKLVEAFARVLANSERAIKEAIPKKVVKDRFSVHEQMVHIKELIAYHGTFDFEFLFEPDFDKGDIVITFLAVLELMKYGQIRAEQEEIFGKIMLYNVEGNEEALSAEGTADGEYN